MKNKNFWNSLDRPFFILAPMEDVTDVVFRQVVEKASPPDIFFTEFMNVSGFCHPKGRESVSRRLETYKSKVPVVAQIWGNKPKEFTKTATELSKNYNFVGIDINMGCPDKSVVKTGGGAGLIKTPELAIEIIKSTRQGAGNLPVSVKTRLGFSKIDEWKPWLTTLLEQDISALTVHLRTRKEMSKVSAHYELIPEIIKLRDEISPDTKLIINGDVPSKYTGQTRIFKEYPGIDGFMIGRGVFANPFCFESEPKEHNKEELIELLKYHLDLFDKHKKEKYEPLKKFFKIYINNFPGASALRTKLMETKSTAEARKIID